MLFLICAVVGCSRDLIEGDGDDSGGGTIHVSQLAESVSTQVQPTTAPERYMVYFAWPKIEGNKKVRIRQEQILAIVQPDQTTFSHEVDHNQTITYTFDVMDSASKVEKSFSKLVKIPRDFVVREGQLSFLENQKIVIKRLFLNPKVPLYTNGNNLEIVVEDLISEDGIIESHPEGSQNSPGLAGKSAGEVILKVKNARGKLKIIMRGQNGGLGISGDPFEVRAADGASPENGAYRCEGNPRHLRSDLLTTVNLGDVRPQLCGCEGDWKHGTNAASGAKGRTGGNGGAGGDTGTLKVEVADGSAFFLETESIPGIGGVAGEGGPGQPGGIAPQASDKRCPGKGGANGNAGPAGDRGVIGVEGKKGLICIYVAAEGKNDCF